MTAAYLIRDKGQKKAAHIWTGDDTACRMWSTGGLKQNRGYTLWPHTDGHEVCHMCANVAGQPLPKADPHSHCMSPASPPQAAQQGLSF